MVDVRPAVPRNARRSIQDQGGTVVGVGATLRSGLIYINADAAIERAARRRARRVARAAAAWAVRRHRRSGSRALAAGPLPAARSRRGPRPRTAARAPLAPRG